MAASAEHNARIAYGQAGDPLFKAPKSFVDMLKEYQNQYPDEKLFTFVPGGTTGYGEATCGDCGESIALTPRVGAGPDGRIEGVGSFHAIRDHNRTSKHRRARNERLIGEGKRPPKTVNASQTLVKRESNGPLSLKAVNVGAGKAGPSGSQGSNKASGSRAPFPIKRDVIDLDDDLPPPPVKRASKVISLLSDDDDDLPPVPGPNDIAKIVSKVKADPDRAAKPAFAPPPKMPSLSLGREAKPTKMELDMPRVPVAGSSSGRDAKPTKMELDMPRVPVAGPSRDLKPTKSQLDFPKAPLASSSQDRKPGRMALDEPSAFAEFTGADVKPFAAKGRPSLPAKLEAPEDELMPVDKKPRLSMPAVPKYPGAFSDDEESDEDLPAFDAPVPAWSNRNAIPPPAAYDPYQLNAAAALVAGGSALDSDDDELDPTKFNYDAMSIYRQVGQAAPMKASKEFYAECIEGLDFAGNTTVAKAREDLGLPADGPARLDNMADDRRLLPHQIFGVSWLLKQEKSTHAGGILADEMGLGKTIQIIALLLKNPPSEDERAKTTLIVAPMSLLEQWRDELEDWSVANHFSILIHHGQRKAKKGKELAKYDIVLTTPGTLSSEWPRDDALELKRQKRKEKKDGFVVDDTKGGKRERVLGPLFKTSFYRVVFDEAHAIRNKNAIISRAILQIQAKFHWALTGTPIVNSLSDAYPLLRYLRNRRWEDYADFSSHVSKLEKRRPQIAAQRLQAIFATTLLRRKKDTELDGKPLIVLPEKHVDLEELFFSAEERAVYDFVEAKARVVINRFIRMGTVMKNYSSILALLLRLRQLCCHPALAAEDSFLEAFEVPNEARKRLANDTVLAAARDIISQEWVDKTKTTIREEFLARMRAERDGEPMPEQDDCALCLGGVGDEGPASILPCNHRYCTDCIEGVLNEPARDSADDDDGSRLKANERPCPLCRKPFSADKVFDLAAFEPSSTELGIAEADTQLGLMDAAPVKKEAEDMGDEDIEESDAERSGDEGDEDDYRPSKRQRKAVIADSEDDDGESLKLHRSDRVSRKRTKKAVIDDSEDDMSVDEDEDDFVVDDDVDEDELDDYKVKLKKRKRVQETNEGEPVKSWKKKDKRKKNKSLRKNILDGIPEHSKLIPSAKILRVAEIVREVLDKEEKIIVTSQWVTALDLMAAYLEEHGIRYTRYQGSQNREERSQSIRTFQKGKKYNVMLLSLKCGGVGLNLTASNHVVTMDLAWSPATEKQAFDRIHRLGQTKECFITRLVIENTVEQRILSIQQRKNDLSDGSLGEGTGKKMQRLSVKEIAALFGIIQQ